MAQRLARRIEAYERQYPGRPVHLVGVSAGTGIAMWTLEAMAPEAMVTGAVLISSSLQAQYDLTRAMSHIRGKLYSFYSPMDVILSAGVTITGTVDRSGNVAGGLFGFGAPPRGPPRQPGGCTRTDWSRPDGARGTSCWDTWAITWAQRARASCGNGLLR